MKAHTVTVKHNARGTWDIWIATLKDGQKEPAVLIEGGFLSKWTAERAAGEYLTEMPLIKFFRQTIV